MTLLFLGEHIIVEDHITCIKAAGEKQTTVWVTGQSAADGGFLVDVPFDEVMDLITGEEDGDGEVDSEGDGENEEEGHSG